MTIRVVFFAAAREIAGRDWMEMEVDDSATVQSLQEILANQFPAMVRLMESSVWSVDHEYVDSAKRLHHGAEVGLIPPVSGG